MTKAEEREFRNKSRKDWESEHTRILGYVINFDEKDFKPPEVPKPIHKCRFCSVVLYCKPRWAIHELRHTGWNHFKCIKCTKEFTHRGSFNKHIDGLDKTDCFNAKRMTTTERKMFVNKCQRNWQSKHDRILGNVTNFNKSDFKPPKPINKCRFCSVIFKCKSHYALHELRHVGWNFYKYIKCGKECANAASFSDHVYRGKGSKCPGGADLSKDELKLYRQQSARDWEKAHTTILGHKTGSELDELVKRSSFRQTLTQNTPSTSTRTKTSQRTSQNVNLFPDIEDQTIEAKNADNGRMPNVKVCKVVLTSSMNNLICDRDRHLTEQKYTNISMVNHNLKECRVVLNKLNAIING